jgi:HEAT repeat protein
MISALFIILLSPLKLEDDSYLSRNAASWAGDLTHADASVRRAAAFALGKLGKHSLPHLTPLFKLLLEEKTPAVRLVVAGSLTDLGSLSPDEALQCYLKAWPLEKDLPIRRQLLQAMGKLGERAARAEPLLVQTLSDADGQARQQALWALGQLGKVQEATIFKISPFLTDADVRLRREAITALGNLGAQSQEVLLPMIKTLSDREAGVQEQAVLALRKLGPLASPSIAPLMTLAETRIAEPSLRQAALITMETVWPTGSKEPASWERLQALAKDADDEQVKKTAQQVEKKVAAIRK